MEGEGALEIVRCEDYVEFFLFPKETENETHIVESPDVLNSFCHAVKCLVAELDDGYIWHKDPFNITTKCNDSEIAKDSDSLPSHLHGITHFGDYIEDEWFIVYILIQLSKALDGLIVRVIDNDGEFLLIEAADVLPEWANPDTCQQRVYIYNGEIHIIPLLSNTKDGDNTKMPKIKTALNMIWDQPSVTRASKAIQDAVMERVQGYPAKIKGDQHRATAHVPIAVAALLKKNPGLISHAVQAFCHRDPIDMKACRAMRYFPPENCVNTSIIFTRCLYAMITHERFVPDKRTGWPTPKNDKERKHFNLGIKVACGFEILVSQAKPQAATTPVNDNSGNVKVEFVPDRGWFLYEESLKKRGYFQELLEGSREYNEKLKKAQEFYSKDRSQTFDPSSATVGQQIAALMSNLEFDADDMKKEDIPSSDDESWLEVHPAELEKMLEERYGMPGTKVGPSSNPANLSGALKDFLNHVSGLEGVEFPERENAPTRPKRGVKKTKRTPGENAAQSSRSSEKDEMGNSSADSKINFDTDAFASTVQSILDFVIPEDSWDLDSDSDASGLGSFEDDAEIDLNQVKPGAKTSPESELKQYMDQMDRELAGTTVGKSFEKAKQSDKNSAAHSSKQKEEDSFDNIEDFKPVDIDMNALKNILESYKAQFGEAGPASNLLGPMGIHLENPDEESMTED